MGFEVYRRTEAVDELHRRNARLDLLAEGAKQLLSHNAPDQIVQALCEKAMGHLDCQVFSCFLSVPGQSSMHLQAYAGLPEDALRAIGCPDPGMAPRDCLHRPGCQRAAGVCCRGPDRDADPLLAAGIRAYACHPLVDQGRNIGILAFGTRTRPRFSDEDLDLMRAVADLVAAAMARQQREEALRENEARLKLALEAARAGIWDWDVQTGDLAWSAEQYELYGVDPAAVPLTLAAWEAVVHPDDLPAARAAWEELFTGIGNKYRDEFRIIHPQRGTRWIMARGNVVRGADNTPLRMYGINLDITKRKSWEKELERRVGDRTAQLEAANQELEGFIYAASHDMKAPLGRINNFSTLLDRNYRERLEGDGLLFLDLLRQNATRLNILVEDLLAHVHMGRQPLLLQPVEPLAAVRAVLHERAEDIRQRAADIRLTLPASITVRGNPLALSQVLRQLVDNALKYSRPAEAPVIEIGGHLQDGRCRLWVRDNGIGLDMAYKDRIFEIFRRLHTYTEYPGSGIGLALVKKAMERMDGKVWVESETGQGATFFLELPEDGAEGQAA